MLIVEKITLELYPSRFLSFETSIHTCIQHCLSFCSEILVIRREYPVCMTSSNINYMMCVPLWRLTNGHVSNQNLLLSRLI